MKDVFLAMLTLVCGSHIIQWNKTIRIQDAACKKGYMCKIVPGKNDEIKLTCRKNKHTNHNE